MTKQSSSVCFLEFISIFLPFTILYALPSRPKKVSFIAGADTTPRIGLPFSIRATLTVNSSFLFINSLVPSRGSINQNKFERLFWASPSSDNIGILSSKDSKVDERIS